MAKPHPLFGIVNKLALEISPEIRRQFGIIQQAQVNPAKAEEHTTSLVNIITKALQETLPTDHRPMILADQPMPTDVTDYWLVEPIHGIRNALHARDAWGISMLQMKDGVAELGIYYQPLTDTMLRVQRGDGAHAKHRLRVAGRKVLTDGMLLLPVKTEDVVEHKLMELGAKHSMHTRKSSCPIQDAAEIAGGTADVSLQTGLTPINALFTDLMVRESGGFVSDWQGKPVTATTTKLVAANSKLHGLMLKSLNAR